MLNKDKYLDSCTRDCRNNEKILTFTTPVMDRVRLEQQTTTKYSVTSIVKAINELPKISPINTQSRFDPHRAYSFSPNNIKN